MNEKEKVVLITGANKGLGKEIASQLAAAGYTVVIGARNLAAGQAVADALTAAGHRAHAVQLEVTDPADIDGVVSWLENSFGRLDVLVNNAGIALEWDGTGTSADKMRKTFDVNVVAPWALTTALVPLLSKSDDARVINQSSILGSITIADQAWEQMGGFVTPGYAGSKAALNMLTMIQSKSLAPLHIAVAVAHPGWVKTDLGSDAAPMEVVDGAKTVVGLVTIERDQFPHGQFQHLGNRLPW